MNDDLHDFEQFMKRREDAARAYVRGDAAPLGRIVARVSPATFFGPRGGYEQGPDHVYSIYERDAAHFTSGDTSASFACHCYALALADMAQLTRITH